MVEFLAFIRFKWADSWLVELMKTFMSSSDTAVGVRLVLRKCKANETLDLFMFCLLFYTWGVMHEQETDADTWPDANTAGDINTVQSNHTTTHSAHKGHSHAGLRYGWHPLTNTGKSHFLSDVWFMSTMCHYERNVSVRFPIRSAAGHHMYTHVEQNIEHPATHVWKTQ